MSSSRSVLLLACVLFFFAAIAAETARTADASTYELRYNVDLLPSEQAALVTVAIPDARLLRELDFRIDSRVHSEFRANGTLEVENERARWTPPADDARLTLRVKIPSERDPGEYDAYINDDWAIFRGDDLVPPATVRSVKGAESRATLHFDLPKGWPSVNTGWPRDEAGQGFLVDNPQRRFDRPTGWMIAGKTGTRRDRVGQTRISVSAPVGTRLHRMDVLSFLNFVWPELENVFRATPPRLLIVGAGEPMWRGGLSGPNSLFLHADRPLVSENGTSALIHELVHMVGSIRGKKGHDWIAEGIAEFYAVELLHRAGGMTDARREKVFDDLGQWGADVETLIAPHSTGARTARATILFRSLDQEIRKHSRGGYTLDDVVPQLMDRKTSLQDLRDRVEALTGKRSRVLASDLLAGGEDSNS
ncbi:hypothetical protein ACXYTJ_09815 [Gilvimarinus sp. F26214L]|uniref:hypothetical protein n=1 Tax=Gilvimarinus sp. DZF01 TaxID=3461371 RepID=UPI0040454D59